MAIKTGTGDDDIIIGTDGNDLIFGFGGDDDIVAGDGADVVYGGSGDDAIDGGQGNDALFGGSGNDVLFGGDGNDLILGGSGDDTIDAGAGNNIVTGGTGDDRFIFESGSGQLLITDFHAGPGSSDLIVLRNFEVSTLPGLLALAHDIGGNTVIDFNNGDRLILAGVNKADLLADDFAFETMGTGGSDIITGTSSDDVIDAGGGDDEIIYTVGGGFDVVDGGEGTDDFVLQGIDTAQTGVLVEDGATYAARTGDLTVAPDHIAISVNGQLAADLDNIEDLVFNAGALGDTIDVSGDFSGTDLAPETIRVVGGAKKDAVRLSPVLTSTKKVALIVEAGGGDDEVKAASGRDVLAGEDGNDVLIGGSGNDLLIGGAGNDTLDGGDDYDIAIFGSPSATYRTPLASVLGYDITIGAETGAATIVDTDPSNGDDGTDVLAGIEEVRFGDLTLFLDGLNNSPFIGAAQLSGSIAELPDGDPNENQFTHSTQGTIDFREFDRTLGHTVTAAPNGVDYRGELTVEFSDSDTSDGAGQINWTFSVDDTALDDLADGQVLFQTYDVTIDDGNGGSATATVTVRIDGASDAANAPPVAVGELMATDEETVLSGRNLLADNGSGADYDPDLTDTFTINTINGSSANVGQQITLSSGALLTVQANGDLVFDPRGAFDFVPEGSGSADNFTYTLIDQNGAVSNEALVNLSVIGVNDAPVAVGELMATDEETVLSGRNLLADNGSGADYDPDLTDTFTINTINGSSANVGQQITLSSGALLTVQANGDLVFDPRGAFDFVPEGSGSADNFTYTLIDQNGAVSNEALVNLSVIGVNDAPVAVGELMATDEETVLSGRNLLADNGSGADYDPDLTDTFTINTINGSSANVGQQITLSSGALLTVQANGDLVFDPRGAFDFVPEGSGSADNFTYTLIDQNGAVSNEALVNLSVIGVNDAPVAVGELMATDEETVLSGRNLLADNGSGADYDPDLTDTFTINTINGSSANVGQQITLSSGALLTVQANGDLVFDPRGAFDFVPEGSGSADNFTYTLIDQNGAVSNEALVNLSVIGVNDAPVAVGELMATDEETVLSGRNLLADNGSGADYDPDLTDTFTINTINGSSANVGQQITLSSGALLTVQANGDLVFDPRGAFDFVPEGSGSADNFTYTLIDQNGAVSNEALVNLSVIGVNDAPVAVGELMATDEETVLSGRNLLADNGSGADYDPDLTDTFTINTINGSSANVGQQITLSSGALLTVQANGDLVFDPRGAFDFVPEGSGSADNFTYTLIDQNGAVSNEALVNLSVIGVNDAPVAVGELMATDEETVLSGRNLLADNGSGADYDPDLTDTFTINTINGSSANVGQQITLSSGALLTVQANGDLVFDPRGAFDFVPEGSGSADNFTYTLIDQNGAVSNEALVNLSVIGVNDPPVVSGAASGDRDVIEDSDSSAAGALTITDADLGEDRFQPVAVAAPSAGEFGTYTVTAAGAWAYTLDNANPTVQALVAGEVLADSFDVVSFDGTVTATVDITITGTDEGIVLQPSYNIADIIAGTADLNGFVINGIDANDLSGQSVSSAGDVNGDGIDDLIIGAPGADPAEIGTPGQAYVVFGTQSGFSSSIELSALNGTNGFAINGVAQNGQIGLSVSGAGDINDDGLDDLIVSSQNAGSYLVYGSNTGFGANGVLDLALLDGTNGVSIGAGSSILSSVSEAGDVNGDGIDDLVIGSPTADPGLQVDAGESYVVFGSASGLGIGGIFDLNTLDGTNGFVLIGPDARDRSGESVSAAGDVNGDGIDDLIIGATGADPNGDSFAGESYVVFGSTSGFGINGVLDLSTLNGTNGFVVNGIDPSDASGTSVSGAGDINGDGIDDIVIGAEGASGSRGESYVVFGSASGIGTNGVLELDGLDGTNGFLIVDSNLGGGESLGHSVSVVGDINNDGYDDLIIGSNQASPNGDTGAGQSYVLFGSAEEFGISGVLDLATLDGTNGFVMNGIDVDDGSGFSVSGAGDVNGDGFDDLLVAAFQADPNGSASGESYVIFGGDFFI